MDKKVQVKLKQMEKKKEDEDDTKELLKEAVEACLEQMVLDDTCEPPKKRVRIEATKGMTPKSTQSTLQAIIKHIKSHKKNG